MIDGVGIVDRVDQWQRGHPVVGFPLAVAYKFFDDAGGYLCALLTYYAFVSLFPLLLLLSTILSVLLSNDPAMQQRIIDSALRQLPVVGDQLGDPQSLSGGATGVVVGVLVSLYGALGAGNALQYTMNTIWAVPRNSRPNPFLTRARSLLLIPLGLLVVLAVTGLSTAGNVLADDLGGWVRLVLPVLTVTINAGVTYLVYRIGVGSTHRRHLVVGSVLAAVLWQLLQSYGVALVARIVRNASATNGVVGFVLGLLAFIYLSCVILVLGAELNAVWARRLFPRALLTPFTDNVSLTEADVRQYGSLAEAARLKGFQRIHVVFDDPD